MSATLGKNIRKFRERLHFTQIELAKKVGVSRITINRIERGRLAPSLKSLQLIAGALETTLSELVEEAEFATTSMERHDVIEKAVK